MEARNNRDEMVICTKFSCNYKSHILGKTEAVNFAGNHKKSLTLSLRDSLKKLKTEYVSVWSKSPPKGPSVIDRCLKHPSSTDRRVVPSLGELACTGLCCEAGAEVYALHSDLVRFYRLHRGVYCGLRFLCPNYRLCPGVHSQEIMNALDDVVKSGKVLYLGVSDTPAWWVAAANTYARAHAKNQFVVYQGRWNVMAYGTALSIES